MWKLNWKNVKAIALGFSWGLSIKYVSTFEEGGGVSEMLTLADMGEGGLSRMLTSAIFTLNSMKIWIQNM